MNFKIVKNFVDTDLCAKMSDFLWKKYHQGAYYYDVQCGKSPAFVNPFSTVNIQLTKRLSEELKMPLYPTYNHARLYFPGEVLKPHKDKPQCEVALSVTLGYEGEKPWPIYVYHNDKIVECVLDIGDILIYEGFDTLHWRNSYEEGQWQTQAFLFYNKTPRFNDPILGDLTDIPLTTEFDQWLK